MIGGGSEEEDNVYCNYPSGVVFNPKDLVLLSYLHAKLRDRPLPSNIIKCADVYGHHPEQLKEQYARNWPLLDKMFFFGTWQRKYIKGNRPDRSTLGGYWKAAGGVQEVRDQNIRNAIVGYKRTLNFFNGKQRHGTKTTWIMQEFFLRRTQKYKDENELDKFGSSFVCKIYQKYGSKGKYIINLDPSVPAAAAVEQEASSCMMQNQETSDEVHTELAVVPLPAEQYQITTPPATYYSGPNHQFESTIMSLQPLNSIPSNTDIYPYQAYNSTIVNNFNNYVPDELPNDNFQFTTVNAPLHGDNATNDGQLNLTNNFCMNIEGTTHPTQALMNPLDQHHYDSSMNIQTRVLDADVTGQQFTGLEDVELYPLPDDLKDVELYPLPDDLEDVELHPLPDDSVVPNFLPSNYEGSPEFTLESFDEIEPYFFS